MQFTRLAENVDTPVAFELSGETLSDALGPQLQYTTQEPFDSPSASALPQLTFYWLPLNSTNLAAAAQSLGGTRSGGEAARTDAASPSKFAQQGNETAASEAAVSQAVVLPPAVAAQADGALEFQPAGKANAADARDRMFVDLLQSKPESATSGEISAASAADFRRTPTRGLATVVRQMQFTADGNVNRLSEGDAQATLKGR